MHSQRIEILSATELMSETEISTLMGLILPKDKQFSNKKELGNYIGRNVTNQGRKTLGLVRNIVNNEMISLESMIYYENMIDRTERKKEEDSYVMNERFLEYIEPDLVKQCFEYSKLVSECDLNFIFKCKDLVLYFYNLLSNKKFTQIYYFLSKLHFFISFVKIPDQDSDLLACISAISLYEFYVSSSRSNVWDWMKPIQYYHTSLQRFTIRDRYIDHTYSRNTYSQHPRENKPNLYFNNEDEINNSLLSTTCNDKIYPIMAKNYNYNAHTDNFSKDS
jgi:hypothetical protein